MIKLSMIQPLGGLLKRIGAQELIEKLKGIDMTAFTAVRPPEEDITAITKWAEAREKVSSELGIIIVGALIEHLEDAAPDMISLVAAYKAVTSEEAAEMDALEVIGELLAEPGFKRFFTSAARAAM